MVINGGGFRIPGWFVGTVAAVAAIVTITVAVLNDRGAMFSRIERLEDRLIDVQVQQCAIARALNRVDPRFDPELTGSCRRGGR